MCTTRREFISKTLQSTVGVALAPLLPIDVVRASGPQTPVTPGATGERIAAQAAWLYRVYCSKSSATPDVTTWAQIDLGTSQPIDAVKLYPSNRLLSPGDGFPVRFRIECSEDQAFSTRRTIVDWTRRDYPDPKDHIVEFPAKRTGRYVRLTVTRLRAKKPVFLPNVPESVKAAADSPVTSYLFALAKIGLLSQGVDIGVARSVSVDDAYGDPADAQQLTRPSRPQGEGLVTDHPQNVTARESWRPATEHAQAPHAGVTLSPGLFKTALQNNIQYLLESFSVDELLHPFREHAGKPVPVPTRKPHPYWDVELAGSNAGRFLMGAGTTLQWLEDAGLRQRMNTVVEGIAQCRQKNGYVMPYPEDHFFSSERGAYCRAWLTHGLIEAGCAGNTRAFELLRAHYDWYNRFPGLPQALRGAGQGGQGMVANTRLYFTPVGRAEDLQVLQRYFQENYWLEDLTARRAEAIWQYPYDHAHVYLLTHMEAYLDLHRATGEPRYLDAVLGGWQLFWENWRNVGGVLSVLELVDCPPKSNSLYERLGETCGNAFWVLLNHRLHLLDPENERYVAEIEQSFYNVLLANQAGTAGIRYHTMLLGHKDKAKRENTCCEGQAARLLGNFPQYIYSIAGDGLYVNLFESSMIEWQHAGEALRLQMETEFPQSPDVRLKLHAARPVKMKIRVRTPSWAQGAMSIELNGERFAQGVPGHYVVFDRQWRSGDVIAFRLPMGFKLTRYEGVDQLAGHERYALEYGPLLMAALNAADKALEFVSDKGAADLPAQLKPMPGQALHFVLNEGSFSGETKFIPYFEVEEESFSCFPIIETTQTKELPY